MQGAEKAWAIPWRGTASSVRHHQPAVMFRHVSELREAQALAGDQSDVVVPPAM